MPATVIDTAILSDYVTDGWNEVILDAPLGGNDRLIALALHSTGAEPPATYVPADPSALVPPAPADYHDFVTTSNNSFEYTQHPDAPYRFSCRLNTNDFPVDGGYAIGTRDTVSGQFSVPYLRTNPRIFGVSKKSIYQGDWIFVWGLQFHPTGTRSGLFLVPSGGTSRTELPLQDVIFEPAGEVYNVRAVKIPATTTPGNYLLVAHNGTGAQYGWSNARDIAVLAALTPPTATQKVTYDPQNAAATTSDIQAKINTLDASGGGTLYWPAGDYTLTSAITLKPKVKNVALGAVRVFRSHNTAGVPMFYPDDDCSFEGFHLEPYPVGVTTVANYDLFTLNGTKGKNVTLTGCHLEHGTIGEWASENFVVFECTGDRFALNQLKGNTTVLNYRGSGMFSHPISSWEGRDIAIVNTELEGTDRGIVIQPSRGSSSILAYRVTIRDVNQVANGAEGLSLEGGNNWDSVPFTQNDSTHVTLSRAPAPDPTIPYSPVPSITPFQTHAFFRYAGGQGEAIRITAYNSSTKQVTLERPKRGTAAVANVELVWGHVESEFVRIRKSGGATAPAFVMFRGFTHGIYVNDYQGNDGGAISFHRNPDSRLARNTQQQNWFNNCQFRLPVWQFQYPNDNPDDPNQSIYQLPGGAFYYESSAAYNLVSNTVVELPSVNNSSQMFMIWEAMGVPVVQRCLGTNSGNLMSRSFVKGAKPYVLNRGGVLRNCVSDYLRVTTSNVLGNTRDLTYDGNTPSVSFPLSRIAVPPGESWMCILNVVARQRENGSSKIWSFAFGVQNYNGATNLIGTGGVRNLITPDASPAWTCTVTADDTNDALKVSCVGASGATIDWEGSLEVVRAAP